MYKLALVDWQEELTGLSDDQISIGLSKLPKSWPPTSGEFRMLCEEKDESWEHNTAAYKVFDKSTLIEKKADVKAAKKACNKMRQILKEGKR